MSWDDLQNDIRKQGDGTEWEVRTYLHLSI
jgi:hypothetical protein